MTENKTQLEILCEQKGIRLTLEAGAIPPNEDFPGCHRYLATIHIGENYYCTPFYTGTGWVNDPNITDVMSALLLDASLYESATDMDDFAKKLDITKVSEAIRNYEAYQNNYNKLVELLGDDFDEFINCEY